MHFMPVRSTSKRDLCILGAVFVTLVFFLHNPFLGQIRQRRSSSLPDLMSKINNSTLGVSLLLASELGGLLIQQSAV